MKHLFGSREFRNGQVRLYGCTPGWILMWIVISIILTVILNLVLNVIF